MQDTSTLSTVAAWCTVAAAVLSAVAVIVALWLFKRQSDDRHEERALSVTFSPAKLNARMVSNYIPSKQDYDEVTDYAASFVVSNASTTAIRGILARCTYPLPSGQTFLDEQSLDYLAAGDRWTAVFDLQTVEDGTKEHEAFEELRARFAIRSTSSLLFRDSTNVYWHRDADGLLTKAPQSFRARWASWRYTVHRRKSIRGEF